MPQVWTSSDLISSQVPKTVTRPLLRHWAISQKLNKQTITELKIRKFSRESLFTILNRSIVPDMIPLVASILVPWSTSTSGSKTKQTGFTSFLNERVWVHSHKCNHLPFDPTCGYDSPPPHVYHLLTAKRENCCLRRCLSFRSLQVSGHKRRPKYLLIWIFTS